jgi:hypothetical protein
MCEIGLTLGNLEYVLTDAAEGTKEARKKFRQMAKSKYAMHHSFDFLLAVYSYRVLPPGSDASKAAGKSMYGKVRWAAAVFVIRCF